MRGTAAVLDLSPGAGLVVDGREWTVERREPHLGRVQLVAADGERQAVSFRFLANHPGCRASSRTAAAGPERGRQVRTTGDLPRERRELALLRMAHLLEVATGFRGGDPLRPGPGEPRTGYDPGTTTLSQRRLAKVTELAALDPQQAKLLGLARVGYRTLIRWERDRRRFGLAGCADGRWLRESGGHPSVSEQVREALFAVREETRYASRVSMRTKERMVHRYVRERFGDGVPVPGYDTLRRVWREWFGPGGTRPRYARTVETVFDGGHVLVHRPGQVVALDTTVLPVFVREGVFGEPVKVHLTIALDVYTHSVCAFRLTLVSDTAVDVAMLLRDVMMPLPMRAEWGEDLEWPYPGLPAAVVAQFAGHKVAGLPFFAPETVTTDHGAVYRNHHLVEVQRVLGCNVLPARALRPTDKAACERAFGVIRQLLFEQLPGYTGVDVADRGADPADGPLLTVEEMEHLIATWVVAVWQRRALGEFAPGWDPDGSHSPNTLFAASFAQTGFAMDIPSPELFYELLPTHYVRIDRRRGVKIRGLWYDDPKVLGPYRGERSTRGGAHPGTWVVRRDPRDRRFVFFQDPLTHDWHPLAWTGMPHADRTPAFGDARAGELLKKAEAAGLRPRSDRELLPVLLEMLADVAPVDGWRGQPGRSGRIDRARETAAARTAAADRPPAAQQAGPVREVPWPQQRRQVEEAVDGERRHRREAATVQAPAGGPARPLSAAFWDSNPLLLPADTDEAPEPPR
ncbi:transposase [Kitasatospora sp. cg17-2]